MTDDGKTRIIKRGDQGPPPFGGGVPTRAGGTTKVDSPSGAPAPTRKVESPHSVPAKAADSNKTKLVRPRSANDASDEQEWNPVVGWVVVVDGPGKGNSLNVGIGYNHLGRGDNHRINLNFGDESISREAQATITFDQQSGKFFVMPSGQGVNMVYHNSNPLLQYQELEKDDEIKVGATILRFCPFCSADFKWDA